MGVTGESGSGAGGKVSVPDAESKEVPSNKGIGIELANSQELHDNAQEKARQELSSQLKELRDWCEKKGSQMDVTRYDNGNILDKDRKEGVWQVEGERARNVVVFIKDQTLKHVFIEDTKFKGDDVSFNDSISFTFDDNGSIAIWSQVGGNKQEINYDDHSKQLRYIKIREVPYREASDVFDYSREALNFLNKATLQQATPASPATGQPAV